jgi:outer membrane protein assembly factor BamD
MCSLQRVQTFDRAQLQTKEALAAFRLFRSKYPQDQLLAEAEEHIQFLRHRLVEHEFAVARFYYRKKAYQAAIGRLLNLIQVYPDTPDIDAALYMLADSYREEENYRKAQGVLQLLIERFPTSKYVAQARTQLRELPQTGITLQ